jgi:type II secretory pathway pseudopilin PulG
MPLAVVAAVVGIGAAVGSTVMQMGAANKQRKAAQRSFDAEQEAQRVEQARANAIAERDRIAQVREERIRRANVIASAGNAGIGVGPTNGGSSGLAGATGSLRSQLGQNLGNLGQMSNFAAQISAAHQQQMQAASDFRTARSQGAAWQGIFTSVEKVSNAASSFFSGGGKQAGLAYGGGNTWQSPF